jgi:hypothetical protein
MPRGSSLIEGTFEGNGEGIVYNPEYVNNDNQLPSDGDASNVDTDSSQTGGGAGTSTVREEQGGNLGTSYLSFNTYLLLQESVRRLSSSIGLRPVNHRFQGHRESNKFNLWIQKLGAISSSLFITSKAANDTLEATEIQDVYPLDEEIELMQHTNEQIRYKEWLLLRSPDNKWYK